MKIKFKIYKTSLLCLLLGAAQQVLAQSPGGVSTNLQRWYKPEAGITVVSGAVSDWQDQAASVTVSQTTAGNRPTYNSSSNLMNFHPTVQFDGSNDRLTNASGGVAFGTGAHTFYYVASSNGTSTSRWAFGNGASFSLNGFNSGTAGTATSIQSGGNSYVTKASVWTANIPALIRAGFNGGTSQPYYSSNNGTTEVNSANVSPNITATGFSIGARPDGAANYWNGRVVEVIAYSGKHAATDYNKVESYLALKYGIKKSGNYVNSVGTTVWTSGGGYDNNVAGIARDDMGGAAHSGLNQKQGQSSNSGSHVVMALGSVAATNAANANTFSADQKLFLWGDNNGSITAFVSTGNPTYPKRFTRIWKTQNTGSFAQGITVYFPVSTFGTSPTSTISLLYGSSSASLSSGTASTIAQSGTTTINGVNYYIFVVPSSQIASMQFFSFTGTPAAGPGGVSSGLQRWFKSDYGITTVSGAVSDWMDVSGTVSVGQSTATRRPTYGALSDFNFNPTVTFDGSDDRLTGGSAGVAFGTGAHTFYYVADIHTASSSRWAFGNGANFSLNGFNSGTSTTSTSMQSGGNNYVIQTGVWGGTPTLVRTGFNGGTSERYYSAFNAGSEAVSTGTFSPNITATGFSIGARPDGTINFWPGTVTEVIAFSGKHTATDYNRVQSYLALKYGLTLGSLVSPLNYLASDGSIIWPASTIYQREVFGIAKDIASDFEQQISQPTAASTLMFSTDTNFTNLNGTHQEISGDLKYVVAGNDGASMGSPTALISGGCPLNGLSRIPREWKVYATNIESSDFIHVRVDLSSAGFSSDVVMLVSSDSLFNTFAIVPGTFVKSTGIFRTKYSFANGRQFITFAGKTSSTCVACETGQLILKNADTWRIGGTAKRTANVITGVALGTVGSGAISANLRLLDPSGVEYQATRNPGTYKKSWMMMRRYDNSTTAALTYAVKLSQPAKIDFQVARIIKASGQTTQVTFLGYCNGVLVTDPTLSRVKNLASRNAFTISGNVVTGTRNVSVLDPYGIVKVNYTQPVDSIAIVFKMLRSPVRKVLRSIFVSNMNITCGSPVEPTPDNVYMYQTFNVDTATICDTVTMQVKIKSLNCDNKIVDITNTLPAGLSYIPNSYLGDDVDSTSNPSYSGASFSLDSLIVPPGEHSYYIDVYHSGTIVANTLYKNQTQFTVRGGSGDANYSDGDISTSNTDSTEIVFKPSVPKVMPDSFIKSCDRSNYSTGGTLTYSFKFVNSSGSPITGLDFEDILDDQLTFQSATLSSSLGGTVGYTDDSASLTIANMTIPIGTTTFSIKVNVNSSTADTLYNYATLTETVESDCSGSTTRESNQVPTPRQLIDCILVNPRVSQRLKAP